jgi:hypothetical protein
MIGLSTKAPRFEFVFTPTTQQFSWEKGLFRLGERLFFGFLSLQAQLYAALYSTTRAFWVLGKTLAAHTYSS